MASATFIRSAFIRSAFVRSAFFRNDAYWAPHGGQWPPLRLFVLRFYRAFTIQYSKLNTALYHPA
ncbi:MAG: hypothetical protein RL217_1674 [Pseudomonadota bacterium]|jgi:hypothetical protein